MNDLLSRMLMRVTQPSPVEPVLPSRYERAGAFGTSDTFEPVEDEREWGIESRPMARRSEKAEDADVFETPARKMVRRRSGDAEQGLESSSDAGLRGSGETQLQKLSDEGLSRPETQQRVGTEEVRPEATSPVRDERAAAVREIRIERERVVTPAENAPSRALSPRRELPREAAGPAEVHVTIGHIEVRAAAAPAKAPARKAAPPNVSLQEYLARRNGGSR